MSRGLPQSFLQRVFVLVMLCLVITSAAAWAYKFGDFPGKGSKQVWMQANEQLNKGLHLARVGKFDQAMPSLQKAIDIYPHDSAYFYNLALCYESRNKPGDMQKAENLYRQAIKLAPAVWENWNGLASPLYSMRRFPEAKAAKLEAMKCHPPSGEIATIQADIDSIDRKIRSVSRKTQ